MLPVKVVSLTIRKILKWASIEAVPRRFMISKEQQIADLHSVTGVLHLRDKDEKHEMTWQRSVPTKSQR